MLRACLAALWSCAAAGAAAAMSLGEWSFKGQCDACHAAEDGAAPRQGPNLFGIVGRKAASRDGFSYSDALRASADSPGLRRRSMPGSPIPRR